MGAVAVQSVLIERADRRLARTHIRDRSRTGDRHASPSSILRQLDKASRQAALDELVADLRRAARLIARR